MFCRGKSVHDLWGRTSSWSESVAGFEKVLGRSGNEADKFKPVILKAVLNMIVVREYKTWTLFLKFFTPTQLVNELCSDVTLDHYHFLLILVEKSCEEVDLEHVFSILVARSRRFICKICEVKVVTSSTVDWVV